MNRQYLNGRIQEVNQIAAADNEYVATDLGIDYYDDETKNLISSTFGVIKNSLQSFWYSTGLDPNVNNAYAETLSDPEKCFEIRGKVFYPHPGVGNLHAYNESGNPSAGCFTMHVMG